ncbi:hypothetical protein WL35_07290 [Burkholderia ubonensis]|uniref:hypothetical protein n=1 Tax=Burkholderia ubonensis TaxID=101571 RepID=UPI0007547766|nr:hypothetical protein [Burkholderia ubonensis]KWB49499.1 hypothetical protein WL35_07290 [Burkholderia ubonensis]
MIAPRFRSAVNDDARPFGTHRFDVFGPKVDRPLTLYGLNAFYLWLRLEADSRVRTYCERPMRIPDTRPTRAVDFWVLEEGQERMLIVLRPSEAAAAAQGVKPFPAFEMWSRTHSMVLRTLYPDELDDPEVLRRNRLTMLRYLAASACKCCDAFGLSMAVKVRAFPAASRNGCMTQVPKSTLQKRRTCRKRDVDAGRDVGSP